MGRRSVESVKSVVFHFLHYAVFSVPPGAAPPPPPFFCNGGGVLQVSEEKSK
jgi:hypothetical protein